MVWSALKSHRISELLTSPSAQSSMSCSGRLARDIEVVLSHVGIPSSNITAQNDRTILVRRLTASDFSGGGCFDAGTALGGTVEDSSIVAALEVRESELRGVT
jgi:hypothetical protein